MNDNYYSKPCPTTSRWIGLKGTDRCSWPSLQHKFQHFKMKKKKNPCDIHKLIMRGDEAEELN